MQIVGEGLWIGNVFIDSGFTNNIKNDPNLPHLNIVIVLSHNRAMITQHPH
jgi:hypothetical protein